MGSVGEAAGGRGSCIRSSARQVSRMSTEGEAAPAAETPAEGEPLPEEGSGLPPACMDLTDFLLKVDDFEKMDALDEKAERLENCPNYRQVNGFPIYGTGQPSEAGYQKVLEKVSTAAGEGVNKMIWFNMRKEPLVYVNGKPYAPRSPDDLHRNLDIYFSQQELEDLEINFADIIQKRAAADEGKIKTMKDVAFAENPMDREAVEEVVKAESIKGLYQIYSDLKDPKKVEKEYAEGEEPEFTPAPFPGLEVHRIPVTEERSAGEACFDMMTEVLKNEPASVPCIFSDQMGRGRQASSLEGAHPKLHGALLLPHLLCHLRPRAWTWRLPEGFHHLDGRAQGAEDDDRGGQGQA